MRTLVKGLNKAVNLLALILLVAAVGLAALLVFDSDSYFRSAGPEQYADYDPASGEAQFQKLQAQNPHIVAWLELYDTAIDYPVAQHPDDNTFYLNHDATGGGKSSGSIFLDVYSSPDFTDFNSLVYGHYMEEHAMFGDLKLFEDASFFNTHEYGRIYFQGAYHGLQTLAFLKVSASDEQVYTPHITDERKDAYLGHLSDLTLLQRDEPRESDRLLLLSSCADDMSGGRFVLLCRLTDEVPENPFGEDGKSPTKHRVLERLGQVTGPQWAAFLVALIILTAGLYWYTKQKETRKPRAKA